MQMSCTKLRKNMMVIYILFLLSCFFGRYFIYPQQYNLYLIIALFGIMYVIFIMTSTKTNQVKRVNVVNIRWGEIAVFAFLIVVVAINLLINGLYDLTFYSLFQAVKGIMIVSYFIVLKREMENDSKFEEKFININFWLSNLYFFINIPIIIIQKDHPGFFMRDFLKYNPLYLDHITGFIGGSGTHILSFYWLSLILTNLLFYRMKHIKNVIFLLIGEIAFMLYISLYNDNKMFYLLLVVVALIVIILKQEKVSLNLIVLCIAVIFTYYLANEIINRIAMLNSGLLPYIKSYLYISEFVANNQLEKIERFFLVSYAIKFGGSFGKGIGSILLYNDPNLPKHFGINSMSSRIYEGGLIFYISLTIFHYSFYKKLTIKGDAVNSLSILVLLLLSTFYTIFFEDLYNVFFFSLICLLMTLWRKKYINR